MIELMTVDRARGGRPRSSRGDRRRRARRPRRGGRRAHRQRAGARPRPRLGRLRHRPCQPHARPCRRWRGGGERDEAQLHEPPARRAAGRGRAAAPAGGAARRRCSPCTVSSRRSPGPSRRARRAGRLGYVQTEGGALPGGHSRTVRALRERGLLAGHLTAGAAFGGEGEAITTAGALHHGLRTLGWDAAVCGPGPGIVGSSSPLGHGGMSALDSAHAALALGCPTLLVARMSSGDDRARHRGISHHTLTVLDLLLEPVTVALPAGMRSPVGADLRAGLGSVFGGAMPSRPTRDRPAQTLDVERPVRITRHDWRRAVVDLPAYAAVRPVRRDDGPRAGRGPAVLRGGARRGHGAGRACRARAAEPAQRAGRPRREWRGRGRLSS